VNAGWQPTAALVRAALFGLVLMVVGMLLRRVDLVVIAVPLVVIAVWSTATRPAATPTVAQRIDHPALREGETTTWRIAVGAPDPGIDEVAAVLPMPRFAELDPPQGSVVEGTDHEVGGVTNLEVLVRSTRWGRRGVSPAWVIASSSWAGFRWVSTDDLPRPLVTLPVPAAFDAVPPPATAHGLVGLNRASRAGSGTEFAGIRPFQPGDRLRRIHWPRSMRTGTLHVTATWAEEDRHVALVIDAFGDIGDSDGIDGRASSLDTAVRAAGAIAEHHLRRGERVSLQVLGTRQRLHVPPASGVGHLRRILDRLTAIEPGAQDGSAHDTAAGRLRLGIDPGALVVMLSPLVATSVLERAIDWSGRGFTVVVIDTLPTGVVDDDPDDLFRALAWRIRLLERDREIRRVQQAGVPVVPWRGPGSLDEVLRGVHRRARGPRVVRR
jgi:uncharacterized protein (DUF58 family)